MGVEENEFLTPERKAKLLAIEGRRPENLQLQTLRDLADIAQETLNVLDEVQKNGVNNVQGIGALLADMRNNLIAIREKEQPETPDYAKPVVEALEKLESEFTKAIKKIDVRPSVKVDAPRVNVEPPKVDVDLKGVEKLLKTEVPKAFQQAIDGIPTIDIPETDLQPVEERLDNIIQWLESIDTASRLKSTFPNTLKVTNTDGSDIGSGGEPAFATRIDESADPIVYIGKADVGSDEADPVWQIAKLDTSSGLTKTWAGTAGFTQIWDDRAILTYS